MARRTTRLLAWFAFLWCAGVVPAQGFHLRRPTSYHQTADDNVVTALNRSLASGELELAAAGSSGRLRALLQALRIPVTSQTLVFSKTSRQRHRISPHNPRALYFGPDAYVAWIPGAAALEIAVGDPRLGLVFYTLAQDPDIEPRLLRDDTCLSCHASARTDDEPGLLLRSVFADENGDPIASAGETRVDYHTPFDERWGGWLVTGSFQGAHRGNGIAAKDEHGRWQVQSREAADLNAFADDFRAGDYPVATSDIGALIALEQQATVHNLLIRASMQLRHLLDSDRVLNELLGETGMRDTTARIVDRLANEITASLLLAHEPSLRGHAAAAETAFAADFARQWPRDPDATQLGLLDLRERTFTLPLSPMVHAPAFAALPDVLRQRVLERLAKTLERGLMPGGVTMTPEQRQTLRDHLRHTLPDWPPR